jgi:putative membrane protein
MDHGQGLPPFGWGSFVDHWNVPLGWLLIGLLLIGGYLDKFIRGRQRGAQLPAWRAVSFIVGVLLLLFTVSSAINQYAMSVFWVHMIEHLLLIMVVPVLLVLGHPFTVLRASLGETGQRRFDAGVRSLPIAALTHPAFGFAAYGVVIVGTHLTGFMDQMVIHEPLMAAEQAAYVVSGYLLLLPLVGREPIRWEIPYLPRVLLILVAMVPDTVVGLVLLQSNKVSFPLMFAAHPAWAPAAIDDQRIAGGLMWALGDGLMMLVGVLVVFAMIRDPQRARVLGPWLESARRATMAEHVAKGAEGSATAGSPVIGTNADVDDDDLVLDAYNAMLARISERGR